MADPWQVQLGRVLMFVYVGIVYFVHLESYGIAR